MSETKIDERYVFKGIVKPQVLRDREIRIDLGEALPFLYADGIESFWGQPLLVEGNVWVDGKIDGSKVTSLNGGVYASIADGSVVTAKTGIVLGCANYRTQFPLELRLTTTYDIDSSKGGAANQGIENMHPARASLMGFVKALLLSEDSTLLKEKQKTKLRDEKSLERCDDKALFYVIKSKIDPYFNDLTSVDGKDATYYGQLKDAQKDYLDFLKENEESIVVADSSNNGGNTGIEIHTMISKRSNIIIGNPNNEASYRIRNDKRAADGKILRYRRLTNCTIVDDEPAGNPNKTFTPLEDKIRSMSTHPRMATDN